MYLSSIAEVMRDNEVVHGDGAYSKLAEDVFVLSMQTHVDI